MITCYHHPCLLKPLLGRSVLCTPPSGLASLPAMASLSARAISCATRCTPDMHMPCTRRHIATVHDPCPYPAVLNITPTPPMFHQVDTTSWAATVTAWLTLARCKRAIVAPVVSRFSDSAAQTAGVPLVGCCSQLAPSTAQLVVAGGRSGMHPRRSRAEGNASSPAFVFELGYCAATELGGNCKVDNSGAWQLPPQRAFNGWAAAAKWCLHLCRQCERCTAVSLSLSQLDCSWFAKCPAAGRLRQAAQGFRTLRLTAV